MKTKALALCLALLTTVMPFMLSLASDNLDGDTVASAFNEGIPEPTPTIEPAPTPAPTPAPVKEPLPTLEPTGEPTPTPVPPSELVEETTPEPVKEPIPTPTSEPTMEPTAESTPEPEAEWPAIDTTRNASYSPSFTKGWVSITEGASLHNNPGDQAFATLSKGTGYAISRRHTGRSNDCLLVAFSADSIVQTAYVSVKNLRPMSEDEISNYLSLCCQSTGTLFYKNDSAVPLLPLNFTFLQADEAPAEPESTPEPAPEPALGPENIHETAWCAEVQGMDESSQGNETLYATANQNKTIDPDPLAVSIFNPNRTLRTGYETEWAASVEGGVAPYTFLFSLISESEVYQEFSPRESNAFKWTFQEAGQYHVSVTVTDAAGAQCTAQSAPIAVSASIAQQGLPVASPDLSQIPGLDTWHGGGIVAQGYLGKDKNSELTLVLPLAAINELKIAYLMLNTPYLTVGAASTWTAVTVGGDGVYNYQFGVVKVTSVAEGGSSSGVYEYKSSLSRNNNLTYGVKSAAAPSLYWVNAFIYDTASQYYVILQTTMYDVTDSASPSALTVPGKVKQIVADEILPGMSQTEKARVLHDWLIKNAIYDYSYTYYHADGVLLNGKGVCNSFSEAYRMLCIEAGLQCITIQSDGMNHGWNAVMIDGQWYHVDVTWDNWDDYVPRYTYFLKKDHEIPHHGYNNIDSDRFGAGLFPTGDSPVVDTMRLLPTSATVIIGNTCSLSASYLPVNAVAPKMTWKSSDTTVATVSAVGVVTAKGQGIATITAATEHNVIATCKVTVLPKVAGVTVNKTSAPIHTGKSITLTAAISPANAGNKNVAWTSSDTTVATVTGGGVVTGIKAGSTTITVTTQESGFKASCIVTVGPPVKGVTLNNATIFVKKEKTLTLKAIISPSNAANKSITWVSSNPAVATVTNAGVVQGVKAGSAVITATATDGGFKAVCTVYVPAAVLNKTAQDVHVGKTFTLTPTMTPAAARDTAKAVTWKSSNTAVAAVNTAGIVTGIKAGSATITAVIPLIGGSTETASCTITVKYPLVGSYQPKNIPSIAFKLTSIQVQAVPKGSNPKMTSSNTKVAVIEGNSIVFVGAGKTTIKTTYTLAGAKKATTVSKTITVKAKVEGIKLNKTAVTIARKAKVTLIPIITPSDATTKAVTWTSSNKKVATVSSKGVVTGVAGGAATITAKTKDGEKIAKAVINVTPIYETGIKLNKTSAGLAKGKTLQLKVTFIPSTTDFKTVKWTTSNQAIATVSATGLVKAGNMPGTCTITATSVNGKTAACKVTVLPQKVTSVKFVKVGATQPVGMSVKMMAIVVPVNADNTGVTWSTSNSAIATVDKNGNVKFLKAGKVTITAAAADGSNKAAKKTFTVK